MDVQLTNGSSKVYLIKWPVCVCVCVCACVRACVRACVCVCIYILYTLH